MDFGLTQEQKALKNVAVRFLKKESPIALVKGMIQDEKGYPPSLWGKIAELGWIGILFEERYGGTGGTFLDLSIILEEMGRVLLPGPFFPTAILGGMTILLSGSEELQQRFLPGMASGDILMTMALTETEGSYYQAEIETVAEPREDGYRLRGRKMFVPYAHAASYIICPAKIDRKDHRGEVSLFLVETKTAGIEMTPLVSLDLQKQYAVTFQDAYVPKTGLIGEEGRGWALIQDLWPIIVTAKCCEMLGAMQQVLEMTIDYAQTRRQFGQPISAFQVIQHYIADMAIDLECSKFITYQAAWRLSHHLPSRKEAAMAKLWCNGALKKMTVMAHQIFGAIGFTKESDLYPYFRYAKASETTFGDENFHKEVVAAEMG